MTDRFADSVDRVISDSDFSGVIRVAEGNAVLYERAAGLANRAAGVAITPATTFGIASGTKGFTALTVMSLVRDGALALDTPVRALLDDRLPLIGPGVTIEHLLGHTSGIGDYLDEAAIDDIESYILPVPAAHLASTSDYLALLEGHPAAFEPGTRFAYCNSGYVVLALVAETVGGAAFPELVASRVFAPAGMTASGFPRLDALPAAAAIGYVAAGDGWRTNQEHLPVRGSGDGGAHSTVGDMQAFWHALFAGRILPQHMVRDMLKPRRPSPSGSRRYGLGYWLPGGSDAVMLEGSDAGVSFRSAYLPGSALQFTVISNTTGGAWPVLRALTALLPS